MLLRFDARGEHVHHVTGAHQIQYCAVGQGQWHDAGVRARDRFGQPRPEQAHVGEHLTAPGRAGQRRADDRPDVGLRTIGNRCRRTVFDPHIIGRQFDA